MSLRNVHTAFYLLNNDGTRTFFPLGVQNFTEDQMQQWSKYIGQFTDEPAITTETDAMTPADIDALKSHVADVQTIIDGLNADKAQMQSAIDGLTQRLTDATAANQALRDQLAAVPPAAPTLAPDATVPAPDATAPADAPVAADGVLTPDATEAPADATADATADASAADNASKRGRPAKDDSNL